MQTSITSSKFLPNTAIILAGGLGTRLRSIVSDRPKPMAIINGRPFLEYLIDYWMSQGINEFFISAGYKHEIITNHFGNRYNGARIEYSIENTQLGTGGALLNVMEKISSEAPFLLLNGDSYFEVELKALVEFAEKKDADWCFSLFKTNNTERFHSFEIENTGKISSLNKKGAFPKESFANGGVYLIKNKSLLNLKFSPLDFISLENQVFPLLLNLDQKLFGILISSPFIDIGTPEDYSQAPSIIGHTF